MTQMLIEKLEALKPDFGDMGPGPETASYMDAIDDAIAIVREHQTAPLTDDEKLEAVEVMAAACSQWLNGNDLGSPAWNRLADCHKEAYRTQAGAALAALLDRFELRRKE